MPLGKRSSAATEVELVPEPTLEDSLTELGSPDVKLRRTAARRLAEHPAAVDALCAAAVNETQPSVREAIFTALIKIGTKPVAAGLVPLLQSEDVALRNGATEALKTMPDAVGEQVDEIFAGSADVRIFGVEILGALAHPDSARWLTQIIEEDTELNVCATAVDGLAECGDEKSVAPLQRLLERFPDEPFLEFSVRTALARIAAA